MIEYIELGGYRFRVLAESATPEVVKSSAYAITMTGKIDYQVAPLLYRWRYGILIEVGDALHGTIEQLRSLYDEGDPDANKVTLKDQFENTHEVVFVGDIAETNLSPYILDDCAYIVVPVTLERTT